MESGPRKAANRERRQASGFASAFQKSYYSRSHEKFCPLIGTARKKARFRHATKNISAFRYMMRAHGKILPSMRNDWPFDRFG
jgi:hypothetical protein